MTRMMGHRSLRAARLLTVLTMAAGIVVAGSPARACSCAEMDLRARLPEADGAFVGAFVGREPAGEGLVAITFEVERVVKGEFGRTAVVRTSAHGASCGIEFLGGPRTGLLLDRAADGVWESSLCQQVPPDELLAFAPDDPSPTAFVDPIAPGSAFPWWIVALVGVLVVGGVLFLSAASARRSAS